MVKFNICGGDEAPVWLLATTAKVAKVSSVRVKIATTDVARHILGGTLHFNQIVGLVEEHGLALSDMKSIIAALDYVLKGAVKFNVDSARLVTELEQLGLPRESASAVGRVYASQQQTLRARQEAQTLQLPRIAKLDWRVDCIVASSSLKDITEPAVHMRLTTTHDTNSPAPRNAASVAAPSGESVGVGVGASGDSETADAPSRGAAGSVVTMEMGLDKFRALHQELKLARQLMAAAER